MRAATDIARAQQLIAVDRRRPLLYHADVQQLPSFFGPLDLLVVNDAATLPASLPARSPTGQAFEVRLAQRIGVAHYLVVLMGAGTWRQDTGARPAPPLFEVGDVVRLGRSIVATVTQNSSYSRRLVALRFDLEEEQLLAALFREARAIQYSYHERDLPMAWLQSPFAGRPWAVEMPSAGRALSWRNLVQLRRAGVRVAALTHSAGLSATGEPALDARLPLRERYDLPQRTIDAICETRASGGRVIAVGTTVVRALEGCALERGALRAGTGHTSLILGPSHALAIVDGVLSGLHAPGESHFELLSAFASARQLEAAFRHAQARGLQNHELGDAMLLVPDLEHKTLASFASRHALHCFLPRSRISPARRQVPRSGRGRSICRSSELSGSGAR